MKNPLKRLPGLFNPHLRRKDLDDPDLGKKVKHEECWLIWPDGTWRSSLRPKPSWKLLDNSMRGELLRCWALEQFDGAEKGSGRRLNPGMFNLAGVRIESGWVPSEKWLKALWLRDMQDIDILHYVVAQLRHTGMLRA